MDYEKEIKECNIGKNAIYDCLRSMHDLGKEDEIIVHTLLALAHHMDHLTIVFENEINNLNKRRIYDSFR